MTNSEALRIIGTIQTSISFSSEERDALDTARMALAEADYMPRTGIEAYGEGLHRRRVVRGRREALGQSLYRPEVET